MKHFRSAALTSDASDATAAQVNALRERLDAALRIADQLTNRPPEPVSKHAINERYIRKLLQLRRNRDRFFRSELFADPAWDILLELYASALGQYRMTVSNLCLGAAVPNTTGLRWIKQLEDEGLICRRADPTDGRRVFLELSADGLSAMEAYFQTVPSGAALI